MAIWQYQLSLMPKTDAERNASGIKSDGTRGDTQSQWELAKVERWLDERLPRTPTWSELVTTWGQEDGHRIRIVRQGNHIAELIARIDLRQAGRDFLTLLLQVSAMLDAEWANEAGHRLPSNTHAIGNDILASPAARFVTDPRAFLME